MNRILKIAFFSILVISVVQVRAQEMSTKKRRLFSYDSTHQEDLADLGKRLLRKGIAPPPADPPGKNKNKPEFSFIPAAGYTLQTGFAAIASANLAFYPSPSSSSSQSKISNILTSVTYSQYKQTIFPIQADIWTKNEKYNIITDWRFLKYPSMTYGLGGLTNADSGYSLDYAYIRLHQAIMRKITRNWYAGLGYDLDYYWDVEEIDPPSGKPTDFETYGLKVRAVASGVSLHLQYDSRQNAINPENGAYASIIYRPNFTFIGSDNNWQSVVLDLRAYRNFPQGSHNTLAFWSYDWLTPKGTPPYLLLPSTGWDPYSNTGRGYIQGRFRSKNMLYLESEYRFGITSNGILGGVVFVNAQSFTESASGHFQAIAPGYGGGIRIKLNKYSRTNLCLDYGIGQNGSGGFFVNLGEVF